ncbi:hypothetical protein Tco_0251137 [Tanacetum coccineum]
MLQEDEVFPAEEEPLPADASPTTQSPDYVSESDLEADPEEDDDEDPEEDHVDYLANGGDDDDDEDESSEDDEDDDVDIEADDDKEEEEHPASADSTAVALPAADQAPSAEDTELFETDESAATPPPHPAYRITARISIPAPVPTPVWSHAEIPSPLLPPILSSLPVSPPLPQIPSPQLPISSPVPVLSPSPPVLSLSPPASPIHPLGYRAAMIRLRAEAASTSHLLPLPPPIILSYTRPDAPSSGTPPLHLLSTDRREDIPEVTLPPRKREIRRDLERDVGYGITNFWDKIVEAMQGTPVVMSLRTTVLAQQSQIRELQSADRKRQTVITEMLAADHKRQVQLTKALKLVKRLQTQMAELQR